MRYVYRDGGVSSSRSTPPLLLYLLAPVTPLLRNNRTPLDRSLPSFFQISTTRISHRRRRPEHGRIDLDASLLHTSDLCKLGLRGPDHMRPHGTTRGGDTYGDDKITLIVHIPIAD